MSIFNRMSAFDAGHGIWMGGGRQRQSPSLAVSYREVLAHRESTARKPALRQEKALVPLARLALLMITNGLAAKTTWSPWPPWLARLALLTIPGVTRIDTDFSNRS